MTQALTYLYNKERSPLIKDSIRNRVRFDLLMRGISPSQSSVLNLEFRNCRATRHAADQSNVVVTASIYGCGGSRRSSRTFLDHEGLVRHGCYWRSNLLGFISVVGPFRLILTFVVQYSDLDGAVNHWALKAILEFWWGQSGSRCLMQWQSASTYQLTILFFPPLQL